MKPRLSRYDRGIFSPAHGEHAALYLSGGAMLKRSNPFHTPMLQRFALLCTLLATLPATSCRKGEESGVVTTGKFSVLGTKTDNQDLAMAKSNAENTLQLHPDLTAMVGLYGYNPASCLDAIPAAQRGKVRVFGFDAEPGTIAGMKAGHIEGTVVQQPFEYAYQSLKTLQALNDGQPVTATDGVVNIPVKIITKDSLADYEKEQTAILAGANASAGAPPPNGPKYAFITNGQSSFWDAARSGCRKAEKEFGITVDFQMPANAEDQNRILEGILAKGDYKGVAISVLSPDSQIPMLKQIADKMPLVTHDSDAPKSARKFYHGIDNYSAGKALGAFMRERLPDGGKIMSFVGSLDSLNASERQRGLVDGLKGN
jgi:ribose transport system substrate-binding protein